MFEFPDPPLTRQEICDAFEFLRQESSKRNGQLLTYERFAEAAGLSFGTCRNLFKRAHSPSLMTALKALHTFNVTPSEFFLMLEAIRAMQTRKISAPEWGVLELLLGSRMLRAMCGYFNLNYESSSSSNPKECSS